MSKSILYIGNKMAGNETRTVTTLDTLSKQLEGEGWKVYAASDKNNKVLRLLEMLWYVIKYSRKVTTVLIDTYSTQNFYYAVAVGNICRLLKVPYIPILHGGNLPERLKKSRSQSYKLFNGAKTNVAPSHYLLNAFKAEGYTKLTYIPNTVEIEDYSFLLRKSIHPKLLWVRSFAEIYNPTLALKVFKELQQKMPAASLCMIGPDKDGSLAKCRIYAKENRLDVTFTGKLSKEEWRKVSEDYDIFISTTNFDNTPVSVIEAMALGLPVVSTNVGGVPYLIEDGKTGMLVAPNEEKPFVAAIEKLCGDPLYSVSITQNARLRVEHFDWQKVKLDWEALLGQ